MNIEQSYSPAEVEFLQCLLDRYSENGGIIDLGSDNQSFMDIVRRKNPHRQQESLVEPTTDEVISIINVVTDLQDADALDKAFPEVFDRLKAFGKRVAHRHAPDLRKG